MASARALGNDRSEDSARARASSGFDASETEARRVFVTGSRALAIEPSFAQRAAKGSTALITPESPVASRLSSAALISAESAGATSGLSVREMATSTDLLSGFSSACLAATRTTA